MTVRQVAVVTVRQVILVEVVVEWHWLSSVTVSVTAVFYVSCGGKWQVAGGRWQVAGAGSVSGFSVSASVSDNGNSAAVAVV
jgi:hypothetical protein